jgi:hypothetical protein
MDRKYRKPEKKTMVWRRIIFPDFDINKIMFSALNDEGFLFQSIYTFLLFGSYDAIKKRSAS